MRTDKSKEFVNARFRKLLNGEVIDMKVFRNPNVKRAIVERFKRTVKSKLY